MTNGQYQRRRIRGDRNGMLASIRRAIIVYAVTQGTSIECATRDALTEMRHWCDVKGFDFGDLDREAYQGYLEELKWREDEAADLGALESV